MRPADKDTLVKRIAKAMEDAHEASETVGDDYVEGYAWGFVAGLEWALRGRDDPDDFRVELLF